MWQRLRQAAPSAHRLLSAATSPNTASTSATAALDGTLSACLRQPGWAPHSATSWRSTTVLCVRRGDQVVIMADGQVTQGAEVVKPNVRKVRRIGDHVVGGFAGATADAFTLFERLEVKLEEHPGQLTRAAVELAKLWRTDKYLRRLDATMVVADAKQSLQISGNGDVLEPHDGIIAIGSGGPYALAAARALIDIEGLDAKAIATKAMHIAADACIYTNHNFTTEVIDTQTSEDD